MAYWLSTTTPTSGSVVRSRSAAWIPSSRVAGRHADVGDDHVRMLRLHGGEQGIEVAAHGRDLDVGIGLEQPPHALAHEEMIVGDHEPERHGARIRP